MICNKKVTCHIHHGLGRSVCSFMSYEKEKCIQHCSLAWLDCFCKVCRWQSFFDFHRKTLSGVPFSFTAEMKDRKLENLIKEIESFVDAIDPETCAGEWMIQSGAMAPSRYQQAVNDMDAIRTDAWLLACELREADGKSLLIGLPWNQWN